MSESIYYSGEMENVKPEEWNDAIDIINGFQDAQLINENKEKNYLSFQVEDGWRGGGHSCEELIKEHFEEFCKKKPHIDLRVTAQYIEHAPIEEFKFKGNDFKTNMLL